MPNTDFDQIIYEFVKKIRKSYGPRALVLIVAPIGWGKTALVESIRDQIEEMHPSAHYRVGIADDTGLDLGHLNVDALIVTNQGPG